MIKDYGRKNNRYWNNTKNKQYQIVVLWQNFRWNKANSFGKHHITPSINRQYVATLQSDKKDKMESKPYLRHNWLKKQINVKKDAINSFMREFLSYKNLSIDFLCKSMNWFLYDRDLRHRRVKLSGIFLRKLYQTILTQL